jgi:hypothetical protein
MSNEVIEYVSFQKRVCQNQLHTYKSIISESHPKYKKLKNEYENYVLLENVVKNLENENVSIEQINNTIEILKDAIESFKNALKSQQLNEWNFFNRNPKNKSISEFKKIYDIFKPIATASTIISRMVEKAKEQGFEINSKTFQNLKLSGKEGQEIKDLLVNISSLEDETKLNKIKDACEIIQNTYINAGTNPILTNFIPNDLVTNPVNVGLKNIEGGTNVGTYLKADIMRKPKSLRSFDLSQVKDYKEPDTGAAFGGQSMFAMPPGHSHQHAPLSRSDVDDTEPKTIRSSDLDTSKVPQRKLKGVNRSKFRQIASQVGMSDKDAQTMVRSGFAKWAEENPDQLKKLADLLSGSNVVSEARINLIVDFVEKSKSEQKLVTEVVNKWNKLAGLKG